MTICGQPEMSKSFWTCQSFGLILKILLVRTIKYEAEILFFSSDRMKFCQSNPSVWHFSTSLDNMPIIRISCFLGHFKGITIRRKACATSVDNVSSGWQSTMSSRKECNILFYYAEYPNFLYNFNYVWLSLIKKVCASGNILLECYLLLWRRATFSLNVTRCYDVAQNAATNLLKLMNVEIWRWFNVEIWRCFNVEIWRCFNVEIWRSWNLLYVLVST